MITQSHGYVLIMTLFLLSLASVAMLELAVESHRRALQAVTAQENLQNRWGAISCQRAVLPRCAEVLVATGNRLGEPVSRVVTSCRLSEQRFTLVMSDEQAKVNVNTLATRLKGPALEEAAGRLVSDPSLVQLRPMQRTVTGGDGKPITHDEFTSFGQVFVESPPSALAGTEAARGLADALTCWGDGKLNLVTASPKAVAALFALDADQLKQLQKDLQGSVSHPFVERLAALHLPPVKIAELKAFSTDQSACHSVWIVADAAGRSTYWFVVSSAGEHSEIMQAQW